MEYYRQGIIQPIRIDKVFPASETPEAFKYMQQGLHIGKVIIELRENSTGKVDVGEVSRLRKSTIALDGAASYLLVGGLGGLGRTVSIWMVQHGARNITFLSRSAGDNLYHQDHIHLLESMGCAVQLVRGSATSAGDVARAVAGTPAVLKGIVQMSMVLRDQAFEKMTLDDWTRATEPKVKGTWNLHEATLARGVELDFFILFSSLSGILGQPGQTNYAAANTFLDAFVLYRNHLGLPCTAIDIGAIEGAGYLFENQRLLKKMQGTGWSSVKEEELLEALGAAMKRRGTATSTEGKNGPAILAHQNNMLLGISPTIPLSSPDCSVRLRKDVRMAVYHNMGSDNTSGKTSDSNDSLRRLLARGQSNVAIFRDPGTVALLAVEIGRKLFSMLLKTEEEPNITLGLTELGLDSMVAVEMRSWWKMVFGLNITVLDMMAMGTLEALGKRVAEELAAMYDG
jgi:aryl carrier-like protein